MIGLNIRERPSSDVSLRRCSFHVRIVLRMALLAFSEMAGVKLMKYFPFRLFELREGIAQEVKLLLRIPCPSILILAIDDFRLLRMKLQPTFLHPPCNG